MKNTSIKAYHEEKESGRITVKQGQVLNVLKYNGIATAKQISAKVSNGWKRLSELENMGCIRVCGTTQDIDTNKTVNVYEFVSYKPLHNKVSVKKPLYKNDPKALAHLYDKAFEAGIRYTLERHGYTQRAIELELKIIEAQK